MDKSNNSDQESGRQPGLSEEGRVEPNGEMGNLSCINDAASSDAGAKSGETPMLVDQMDKTNSDQVSSRQPESSEKGRGEPNGKTGNISCPKRRHSDSSKNDDASSRHSPDAGEKSGEMYPVEKIKKETDYHIQLDKLSPTTTTNHTVLVDMDKRNDSNQVRNLLQQESPEKGRGEPNSGQGRSCPQQQSFEKGGVEPNGEMGNISGPKQRLSESFKNNAAGSSHYPGAGAKFEGTYPIEMLKKEPKCHLQLDKLTPTTNHTVLVDTQQFLQGRISPYHGRLILDMNHVKLPHLVNWGATEKELQSLGSGHSSVQDVVKAIKSYNQPHSRELRFDALQTYVQALPGYENNFPHVISKMARLAQKLPSLIGHAIPLLRRGHNHSITMSQEQIACLLANAFFCTFPYRNTTKSTSEYSNFPSINFYSLFAEQCKRKTQKLRALLHYFDTVTNKDTKPDGLVTFERICILESNLPKWESQNETLTNLHVSSKGYIEEEGKGMLQVDFASKFIGGGVLGRGLVQEEIRFLQCPELIVARLFTEKLGDNECLKITGVQKYSSTAGYSDSFEWIGPHHDDTKRDGWKRRFCQIVAIDALNFKSCKEQYNEISIKRELNKAYVGFRVYPSTFDDYICAVATGNWGCGAFNGDLRLKALIQLMAAAVAKREVAFFTFGKVDQAHDLQNMHDILRTRNVTVGRLYKLLRDYCELYNRNKHENKNVFEFVKERTKLPHSSNL
ncbi:poly(ADP-ribose) glycohydrolase [Trichomycterus rosablanca]|uniref:poly(ADP-ribose) glycohydrolase n=1 Tax=Trichomycterus rosablanca TaxID=2290929 RepID=UPI002F357C9C